MLICACPAAISWRLLSTEQSSFFFQPVQLDFELPDLLVEFVLQLCFRSLRSFAAIAKRLLQMLECLLLPLPNLVGMHAVVRRDLVHAAHTLDRFQRHFALQSRAVLPPLFAHRSSARAPILHLIHLSSFWGDPYMSNVSNGKNISGSHDGNGCFEKSAQCCTPHVLTRQMPGRDLFNC